MFLHEEMQGGLDSDDSPRQVRNFYFRETPKQVSFSNLGVFEKKWKWPSQLLETSIFRFSLTAERMPEPWLWVT